MNNFIDLVIYKRVSTQEQNHSNLGLLAQQKDIENRIKELKKQYKKVNILCSITEIQSGKSIINQKELLIARNTCLLYGAYLIVQKVDRLSRNISDGIKIFEELKKRIIFCDLITNDPLIITFMLAQAQKEREQISIRTSKALQQLKLQGKKLGRPYQKYKNNKTIQGQNQYAIMQMLKSRREKSKKYYKIIKEHIKDYQKLNMNLTQIANRLNELNYRTIRNKLFNANTIKLLI